MNTKPWVLITGANGGIGQALVKEFSSSGYLVIATDIVKMNENNPGNVVYIQLDLEQFVIDEEHANSFVLSIYDITKGQGISALINNAAVQILSPAEQLTRAQWQTSFNVNLSAAFFMVQAFLTDLTKNKGAVVNISSIHATQTKKKFVAYATTKAALSSMTRNLAIDLGDKIRINAIEPAAIATDMLKSGFIGKEEQYRKLESFHPIGRIGTPTEVATLAVFLSSVDAGFVQGACISASGGIQNCLSDPSEIV